jgi:hypothetical protein
MSAHAVDLFKMLIRCIKNGLEGPEALKQSLGKGLGILTGDGIAQKKLQELIVL